MNRFGDADKFIVRWDAKLEAGAAKGSSALVFPATFSAAALTPSHPDFLDRIEPGVRDLVRRLVVEMGWITYSSCEGHPARAPRGLMLRHVGLLPRDSTELQRQRHVLYEAAAAVNALNTGRTHLSVRDAILECEGGRTCPVLDIVFVPSPQDGNYFESLAEITELMTQYVLPFGMCRAGLLT